MAGGSGFLYTSDRPEVIDYLDQMPFGRTVFVSFERHSVGRATEFERCLREAGLTPWRYHPDGTGDAADRDQSFTAQIEEYKKARPHEIERLEATIRRCSAVVFLISRQSLRSAFCELEAWIAGIVHNYGDPRNAGVYVILEEAGLEPPAFLRNFWRRVYEPGLEEALAVLISREIAAQSARIADVESRRQKQYR